MLHIKINSRWIKVKDNYRSLVCENQTNELQRKIKQNWFPIKGRKSNAYVSLHFLPETPV